MVKAKETTEARNNKKETCQDSGTREIFEVKDGANTDGSEFFSLTGKSGKEKQL